MGAFVCLHSQNHILEVSDHLWQKRHFKYTFSETPPHHIPSLYLTTTPHHQALRQVPMHFWSCLETSLDSPSSSSSKNMHCCVSHTLENWVITITQFFPVASHSVEEHKIISEEQTCKLVYISNCTDAEFRMYNGQTVRSGKLVRHGFQEDCLSV